MVTDKAMVVNNEMKNELGRGDSSATEQGIGYYCSSIAWSVTTFAQFRSTCPAILLATCGPYLSISVATFGAVVAVDPATPFLPLLVLPHDRAMMGETARALAATKRCIARLIQFYHELPAVATPGDRVPFANTIPPQLHFPYPRAFANEQVTFRYLERIFPDKLLFLVEITKVSEHTADLTVGTMLIVKYTRTYCPEAHRICYEIGESAPCLYACEPLAGGWFLVAMEFLRDARPLRQPAPDIREHLQRVVHAMHDAGYVHGDLRVCNLLLCADGKRPCLVDFDWAGKEGEQVYPTFMNHVDIEWPEGAEDGKPLRKEHDLHFLSSELD
jgi:hypothetical protein